MKNRCFTKHCESSAFLNMVSFCSAFKRFGRIMATRKKTSVDTACGFALSTFGLVSSLTSLLRPDWPQPAACVSALQDLPDSSPLRG